MRAHAVDTELRQCFRGGHCRQDVPPLNRPLEHRRHERMAVRWLLRLRGL